eukprot:487474-Prorocentrum_lima.AAC.1
MGDTDVKQVSGNLFTKYDKDCTGTISGEELKECLTETVGSLAKAIPASKALEQLDEDGSGELDRDEFY